MGSIIYFAQLQCAGALCKQQDTVAIGEGLDPNLLMYVKN